MPSRSSDIPVDVPALRARGRRRLRVVAASLAAAAIFVLGAGSTNAACTACHRQASASTVPSAHRRASCYACHLADGAWTWPGFKAREVLVMYPKALAGKKPSLASEPVSRRACLRCHEEVLRRLSESGGIRISHVDCAQEQSCGTCHASAAHGSSLRWAQQPVMEDCVACHRQAGAPVACDACHSEKGERERLAKGPWQVTHGPGWERTHGMGTLEWCATCHPTGYCVQCHGVDLPHPADFGRTHGALAKQRDAKCSSCHDQGGLCDSCHGVQMPHPKGFLAAHPAQVSSSSDARCLSCHIKRDCDACHTKHIHPGSTDGTARLPRPGEIGLVGGTP